MGDDSNYRPGDYAYPMPELERPGVTVTESEPIYNDDEPIYHDDRLWTHSGGSERCLTHSHTVYASHSDYGNPMPESSDQPSRDNAHLLPPNEHARSTSLPPAVERYLNVPESHEKFAFGLGTKHLRKSKKNHRKVVTRKIEAADRQFNGRRAELETRDTRRG